MITFYITYTDNKGRKHSTNNLKRDEVASEAAAILTTIRNWNSLRIYNNTGKDVTEHFIQNG